MGGVWTRLGDWLWWMYPRQARVCMLGLDDAVVYGFVCFCNLDGVYVQSGGALQLDRQKGKTTILYRLRLGETVSTTPTIGFNVESMRPCRGVSFTVWDVGGQEKLRPLWWGYMQNFHGVVFVVDSSDRSRLQLARTEMMKILKMDTLRVVPLVVLANKQDLNNAATESEIIDEMDLKSLTNRKWSVVGTCATTGDGLMDGLREMAEFITSISWSYVG